MQQPLISLILPIYGVEEYLEECVQSVVGQTYQNLEIILVDDGSPDRCPQIVDEWAAKDPRIRAIHKENGGLSSARNAGMDCARGEYISFIDSDDWVEPTYCEKLYESIQLCNADMAVGRVMKVAEGIKQSLALTVTANIPYTGEQAAKPIVEQFIAAWGKLYKADMMRSLRFPLGRLAEDFPFQLSVLKECKTVVFCNEHLYNYRTRAGSIARSIKPHYLLDHILVLDEAYHTCSQHFPKEVSFCLKRLSALLYEFTAAKVYGQKTAEKNPEILEHALQTVGGFEQLLAQMETPLGTIFYTYNQFFSYLTKEEKQKLQKDYRRCFTFRDAGQYGRMFWIKYLPSYISLELMRKLNERRSAV